MWIGVRLKSKKKIMRNIIYILHIIIAMLFFASCEDDGAVMLGDNEPCYTSLVSAPSVSDTRAYYKEDRDGVQVTTRESRCCV